MKNSFKYNHVHPDPGRAGGWCVFYRTNRARECRCGGECGNCAIPGCATGKRGMQTQVAQLLNPTPTIIPRPGDLYQRDPRTGTA